MIGAQYQLSQIENDVNVIESISLTDLSPSIFDFMYLLFLSPSNKLNDKYIAKKSFIHTPNSLDPNVVDNIVYKNYQHSINAINDLSNNDIDGDNNTATIITYNDFCEELFSHYYHIIIYNQNIYKDDINRSNTIDSTYTFGIYYDCFNNIENIVLLDNVQNNITTSTVDYIYVFDYYNYKLIFRVIQYAHKHNTYNYKCFVYDKDQKTFSGPFNRNTITLNILSNDNSSIDSNINNNIDNSVYNSINNDDINNDDDIDKIIDNSFNINANTNANVNGDINIYNDYQWFIDFINSKILISLLTK